jgi:glucose/arabinose dehydrogenase
MRRLVLSIVLSVCVANALFGAPPTVLSTVKLASGLNAPVYATVAPADESRIFIVEQGGTIRILKNGVVQSTPFLDISTTKVLTGTERGLLGLAFHPAYATNGYFFVYYTAKPLGSLIVERFQRLTADVADASSGTIVFGPISHPTYANHNGGCIHFGPDGYLYIATGDGGGPDCNAQKGTSYLGKIVRIDADQWFIAPPTNPFVSPFDGVLDLIWATGLRNPWRWSFDRETGDMHVADVGQNAIEEINFLPGGTGAGANFGWRAMEGTNCFSTSACPVGTPPCNDPSYFDPIHTYAHDVNGGFSVTGGYVYRGCAIPDLRGTYFFADYATSKLWSYRVVGGAVTALTVRTAELDPPGVDTITSISSFGEDACGEILICDHNGELFKIVPATTPAAGVDLGSGEVAFNGQSPTLAVCGLLDTGNTADFSLKTAPANKTMVLFVGLSQNPIPLFGGTFVPALPAPLIVPLGTGPTGEFTFPIPGGGGPIDLYVQGVIDDVGASDDITLTNAVKLQFQS